MVYKPLSVLMWCGTVKHPVIRQDCLTCHPCHFSSRAFPPFHSGWDGDHVCLSYVYFWHVVGAQMMIIVGTPDLVAGAG